MFIVISDIQIKPDSVANFKKWFSESNKTVSKFDGFVNRRLLETKDGKHRVLVEFESLEKFSKCIKAQNTKNFTPWLHHTWKDCQSQNFTL